ncbi:MAG: hypothetical protein IPL79_00080 [Myxococcales bacterium]|nr:hypothetical protein [Myxococcales bacterium]
MSPLPRFGYDELQRFLRQLDAALTAEAKVVLIGGASAALAYHVTAVTRDVDAYGTLPAAVRRAIDRVNAAREVPIPVSSTPIAEVPYNYEARLVQILPSELIRLRVYVLERHDLVLSKVVRWDEGDERHVQEMHAISPLSYDVLTKRFALEMKQAMGNPVTIRAHLLELVRELFGELAEVRASKRIGPRWSE